MLWRRLRSLSRISKRLLGGLGIISMKAHEFAAKLMVCPDADVTMQGAYDPAWLTADVYYNAQGDMFCVVQEEV
jgi:hypothetical protein